MASLMIRKLEDEVKQQLRLRAARHGRSMEDEARTILRSALAAAPSDDVDLGTAIHRRFARFGGIELETPPRGPARKLPKFNK